MWQLGSQKTAVPASIYMACQGLHAHPLHCIHVVPWDIYIPCWLIYIPCQASRCLATKQHAYQYTIALPACLQQCRYVLPCPALSYPALPLAAQHVDGAAGW